MANINKINAILANQKTVDSAKQWDKARTTTQCSSENSNKLIRNKNTNHRHHLKNGEKVIVNENGSTMWKRVDRKRKNRRVKWNVTRHTDKIRIFLGYYDTLNWLAWKSFVHNIGMTGKRLEFVDNLIELKVKLLFSG